MLTFNRKHFVVKIIFSILKQTRKPDEIITCDDGSTDKTVIVAKECLSKAKIPYKIIEVDNSGPSFARKKQKTAL
jgi:glycosyltransferase involved in cell wall biosynthesis